ncbi:acyl-CoA dehydrogenase family protein [Aeromicrobium alkaliterrae]|uniref:Acyl-CoA dehydrogenase family protein n=1 Tax=Aeromicrobium alkaliterrae TaxID=302168 RepID=A0ABP4VEM0_9ACTN
MSSIVVDPWPAGDPALLAPSAEHEELRAIVRSLLERAGGTEGVRGVLDGDLGYSTDLWTRLHRELEVSSMVVPETLGGAGFALADVAVVLEEAGAVLRPEPLLASSVLAAAALGAADDPDAIAGELRGVMAGELVGTLALAVEGLEVVDGRASGVLHRVLAGATAHLVVLGDDRGLWLLDTAGDGVEVRALEVLDETRRQADLVLTGAAVTALVGVSGAAAAWSRLRRAAAVGVAAEHVGMMARLLDDTVAYVSTREQFGRKIGSFQAVKHRLADVLVDLERSRSAVAYAAALHDADPADELAAAVAASVATDAVVRTVHEAVQLHGGIGFTWEHPAHLYVKRALGDEGLFGSAAAHRRRIADLVGL